MKALDIAITVVFGFGAIFLIYEWHDWVVANDKRVAAQIEKIRCEENLKGALINHVCYLPNRRKK